MTTFHRISCADQLPPAGERVYLWLDTGVRRLESITTGRMLRNGDVVTWQDDKSHVSGGPIIWRASAVTHWAPIPKGPG